MAKKERDHDPTLKFLVALQQGSTSLLEYYHVARNVDEYIAELV